jgi:enolase
MYNKIQKKIILDEIITMSGGDINFIRDICVLFINENKYSIIEIKNCLYKKDYVQLKKLLHKCHPRFLLFGDIITASKINKTQIAIEKNKNPLELTSKTENVLLEISLTIKLVENLIHQNFKQLEQ